jgi:adenylyl-sulfate kinase
MNVLWFTGLSGSGKTTIANALHGELIKKKKRCMVIDGDIIRNSLHKELTFTPEDIKENNRLIAEMCKENFDNYDYIIVPIISPFYACRKYARQLLSPQFIEVYIKAGIQECIRRDVKGLYKRALSGSIEDFIGISPRVPYEPPNDPEIEIDTESENVECGVKKIMLYLSELK